MSRTVAEVVEWYLLNDTQLTCAKGKIERERILRLLCVFTNSDGRLLGESPVSECKGQDLVEFLNAHWRHSALWTRRRICVSVKVAFNRAHQLGLINAMPFKAVKERGKCAIGRDISWEEFRALLRLSTPAIRRVLIFCRFSGARPGELMALEWHEIDFTGKIIVKYKHKTAYLGHGPRIIRLNEVCLALLKWLKKANTQEWVDAQIQYLDGTIAALSLPIEIRRHAIRKRDVLLAWQPSRFVFTNCFGGKWTTRALCKNIAQRRVKAGLPADVRLYSTRHGFATGAILNGVDVATLAELMGHSCILTTQKYVHVAGKRAHLNAAVNKAVKFGDSDGPAQTDMQQLIELLQANLKNGKPDTTNAQS
jgi:integrase